MIIEISIGVIALAFAVLTIFLIKTLRTTSVTVRQVKHTLSHLEKEVTVITHDSHKLIKNLNELTEDLNEKSAALNCLFRPLTSHPPRHPHLDNTQDKVADAIEWVVSGIALYKKLRDKG